MSAREPEDFYVGYLAAAPPGLARWMRPRVLGLALLALLLGAALAVSQRPFTDAVFEFGVVRDFEGIVRERPYPALEVARPGGGGSVSHYLLVRPGKFGAADALAGLEGERVRLAGSLVYRDGQTMIELVPESLERLAPGAPVAGAPPFEELGEMTLRGEIVDSKCFLGVMKPGNLKPHRACAARCISGGIPPVMLVRDEAGIATYLLLAGADGRMVNREVLDMVAEPVEISGRVRRYDGQLVLLAEPTSYRRLD